jgi:hypothetical protein
MKTLDCPSNPWSGVEWSGMEWSGNGKLWILGNTVQCAVSPTVKVSAPGGTYLRPYTGCYCSDEGHAALCLRVATSCGPKTLNTMAGVSVCLSACLPACLPV